ncbi:hypothetical protein FOL47_004678 [Perkinsus chesapeaki]|uniref:Uncharacterized protein n=1 Tax=Perkinsus chesapeaki TaxID=330153 RepID=A0A7J6M199_PERCH|nr:hypothetical protein FOL47_004678 [Perkinsus chesapeaki]
MTIWNDPPSADHDDWLDHEDDEPISIFSERPAEGLVGPLVWCEHMDLLATMHSTPKEGRSVKVWRLLSDERTPCCLFTYKGHSADWHPTALAWSPRSLSHPEQLLAIGDENGDVALVYVEQKHSRSEATLAVLRRAHNVRVAAMEWILTPFCVDASPAVVLGELSGSVSHIHTIKDIKEVNKHAAEKDTESSGADEKWPSEVGYLVTLSEDGHLSVHAEALAPVASWMIPSPVLEGEECRYGPLCRISSDLNTLAVLRTYVETGEQEIAFVDTSRTLGSRGLAEYSKLVLKAQQLQRYISDSINVLLHGPLKSAAEAMKKLVEPLKAEIARDAEEEDEPPRSVTEELIQCFQGIGVPSPALTRALETPGYQSQALQKLQRELSEALDVFSVVCACQLEPAADSLMSLAHSIRSMSRSGDYVHVLGGKDGGFEWSIDQLLTAGEHLIALVDEASSQVSNAIGSLALPLIEQLTRWQRMGEEDLRDMEDVHLREKDKILGFVSSVYSSSLRRCGCNLDHLKDTIRLFGETTGSSSGSQMTLRKCAADIGAILIDLMSSQRDLCGDSLSVLEQTLEITRRSPTCPRVAPDDSKTIVSESVEALDSAGHRHSSGRSSRSSEVLRVCWTDATADPMEPDSELVYIEVKRRSARKHCGGRLRFKGIRVPAPRPTAYTTSTDARISWLLPKIYRDGQVLSLLLHTHTRKPVAEMFVRANGEKESSDHQMSVCLISLEESHPLPRYTAESCGSLSSAPPVISRILPSADYLYATHTSTAPHRGVASIFESRTSKILSLDLEGGHHADENNDTCNLTATLSYARTKCTDPPPSSPQFPDRMSSHAKMVYLSRWSQVGNCVDYEVTSIFKRKQEIDALVDFIPHGPSEQLPTLAELRSGECVSSLTDTLLELEDLEDDLRDIYANALNVIQPTKLRDISPVDYKLPIKCASLANYPFPLDACTGLEPISLISEPEVPQLSELLEVDWLDFVGFVKPFEIAPMVPIAMDDPTIVELAPPIQPPLIVQSARSREKALELDPFSLPVEFEELEWAFENDGDTLLPKLEEKYVAGVTLKTLFSVVSENTVLQEEIFAVSLPAATPLCLTARLAKHTILGPIGLAWESVECDLDRLPPREIYLEAPHPPPQLDDAESVFNAVNRTFKKELVSVRRGVWEQALLWDKSWKSSSTGIPQPPEIPSLEWLEAAPLEMSLPYTTLCETDPPARAEELAVLWGSLRSISKVQPTRLNLCIQSWELISQSPTETDALNENDCTEERGTELTPTQEQDETHFIEHCLPEKAVSEGTPNTPPPALMSCRSDRTSETRKTEQGRLGEERKEGSCLCVKELEGLERPVKIIRVTDEPSAVKTIRSFLDKHWERLRRFCATHGQSVPAARASREEADALWQQALAEGPRRISHQLGALVVRCIVLLTLLEAFKCYGSVGLLMAAKNIPGEYRANPSTLGESLKELLSRLGSSRSVLTQCPILRCLRDLLSSLRETRNLMVVVSSPSLAEEYEKVSRKLVTMIGEDIYVAMAAEEDCSGSSEEAESMQGQISS